LTWNVLENGTFLGMRKRCDYLTTADYQPGWGANRETLQVGKTFGSEDEAVQHAAGLVDEMRRDGSASAIRRVRVRHWTDSAKLSDAPVLFQASYYDDAQGLTDAETYAARVHDWHAPSDQFNRNAGRNNSRWLMGSAPWTETWGTRPDSCPACGADIGG
jgi:hypothetical protein